jgi:DNA-binding protein H-NS
LRNEPKSMATYKELLAQKEALEAQMAAARKGELSGAVDQVRTLIAEFGLTEDDVFGAGKAKRPSKAEGSKVAAKYRDPATGITWTGRGRAPLWIADKDRAEFAI